MNRARAPVALRRAGQTIAGLASQGLVFPLRPEATCLTWLFVQGGVRPTSHLTRPESLRMSVYPPLPYYGNQCACKNCIDEKVVEQQLRVRSVRCRRWCARPQGVTCFVLGGMCSFIIVLYFYKPFSILLDL